jgi:hypothetical protein
LLLDFLLRLVLLNKVIRNFTFCRLRILDFFFFSVMALLPTILVSSSSFFLIDSATNLGFAIHFRPLGSIFFSWGGQYGGPVGVISWFFPPVGMLVGMMVPLAMMLLLVILH